jgi:hypothetical protein
MSYEHPDRDTRWTHDKAMVEHVTRREKHRSRFIHQNVVAIDLTRVVTTDWKESYCRQEYEIEVELLHGSRYENGTDPILSLVWRMLFYGLGMERPEEQRFTKHRSVL